MIRCRHLLLSLGMIAAIFLTLCSAAMADVRSRITEATDGFRDITLTCKVLHANHAELKKIGKDFQKSYDIKSTTVKFKAPDKMKTEGKLGMFRGMIIINGNIKSVVIPSLHIRQKENIKDEPHKRQTELDLGIITGSLWHDYKVIDADVEKGSDDSVYKIVFVRDNSDKRLACWVDTKTLKLLKLEKFENNGSLKARYIYSGHQYMANSIWVPRRVDVYNEDGKLAGSSTYDNIRVNTGIPDSEFKL